MSGPTTHPSSPGAPSALASGFRLPLEGLRLLRRERRLWPLAMVPFVLSLVAFGTAVGLIVAYAGELHGWATAWIPVLEVERWYQWLWIGPARAGLAALGAAVFLALAAACLVAAYLVASLLASPFHDALAARVEQLVTGGVIDEAAPGIGGLLREAGRAIREELRRMAYFLALTLPLLLAGWFVPGAQLLTGPAIMAITIFFLPLDYASYTLDRRRVSFPDKRRWLFAHKPVVAGFGVAAFLTCMVPGLNFLAMPILVVAGTLLALRFQPPR
jgi:CysZ protein